MRVNEPRAEHIKRIQERYKQADKCTKTAILTEFCLTWGVDRKYAIKLLQGRRGLPGKKTGRKPKYDAQLIEHLMNLWNSMERIHPVRMKSALPLWLPFYRNPAFSDAFREQILAMSASTIARFIKRGRRELRGMSLTKRSKFFKYRIPLTNVNEKIVNAGHVAADTVAHCGDNISGNFVWSLTVTDRLTGWTNNRAMPDKTSTSVKKAMSSIEQEMPFRIKSIQTDCGSEFLNYTMMRYFGNRPAPVIMSRSRPYQKNDNAHVEQKNYTHVRELFGYERIGERSHCEYMNMVYRDYWNPLNNFFLPQMQVKTKERVGSRIKKTYDVPQTPFERLKQSSNLSEEKKAQFETQMRSLNPFALKHGLDAKLHYFFRVLMKGLDERKAA
jgi:hypothetical protein